MMRTFKKCMLAGEGGVGAGLHVFTKSSGVVYQTFWLDEEIRKALHGI